MKKHTLFWLVALISVLTACGGKSTTETKFHVIFDNAAPRTMPLATLPVTPSIARAIC